MGAPEDLYYDAVIVGGGLAGLWALLHLPAGWRVLVVDKGQREESGSSPWAQGGMAVAVGPDDDIGLHVADTLRAGAGTASVQAAEVLAREADGALSELERMGCRFDRAADGGWDLNHEGGQSTPRSVHAADATGRELMRVVVEQARLRAERMTGGVVALATSGGRCCGVMVEGAEGASAVRARAVLLGTGGCGALYDATTNPPEATGDGIALAFEAGAAVADLEFVQFHPTALAGEGHRRILLTEALRGAGALVVDDGGRRFLFDHHPAGELGPRDVVARAIGAAGRAFLDARPLGAAVLRRRFPNVVAAAREAGFDLASEPVPIAPAAHFFLGGVATDLNGRTTVPGLYAAGEAACTGVHGANRMAGNSLTESVVFGRRAALAMTHDELPPVARGEAAGASVAEGPREPGDAESWDRLRAAMSAGAGLVRTGEGLSRARSMAEEMALEGGDPVLRLAARAASLICRAALARDESRGVHFRADRPEPRPEWEGGRLVYLWSGADGMRGIGPHAP